MENDKKPEDTWMVDNNRGSERRSGADRRYWNSNLDFPYVDSHGTLVLADRRKTADRRLIEAVQVESSSLDYQKIAKLAN
jgi:hypothetical protein